MKALTVSMKCFVFLLLLLGTVFVESTDRFRFVDVALGEYDLISRVATSVFDDFGGYYKIGAMVRTDVFGNFPTAYFDYGFVQIGSNSTGYDSGLMNLSIAEDGVNYFAFWDTAGLSRANDYVVSVVLADKSGRDTMDSDTVVALSCDPVFKNVLVSVTDVSFPGRGLSTNLARSYHVRSGYDGAFGYGWTHSYDARLIRYPDGSVRIQEGDGSNSWYVLESEENYESSPYDHRVLKILLDGGFQRRYKDGLIETFNAQGKLVSIAELNGNVMTFVYDGWLLARIIDPTGHITYLGYSNKGRISSITDPIGRMTLYEYDDFGNLVSVTDPAGAVTRYAYDSNQNLVNMTDAEGRCTFFEYYANDRLASEYYESGKNKLMYLYDENEPSVTVEDSLGHQTTYIYGENNELVGITDTVGNTHRFYYDTNYNLVRFVDANGRETRFTYDNLGNVLTKCDALGGITSFTYEERFNKVTCVTDALGRKTTFGYDSKGNLEQITYPDGSVEEYGYDELGDLTNETDRKAQSISYSYDHNGSLIEKIYPDSANVAFAYDEKGNLIRVVDENGEISYDYDLLGRNTRVSYPGNKFVKYSYDATGNRVQMIYPDGSIMRFVYDKSNQLTQIRDSEDHVIANYTYDEAGRIICRCLENGIYAVYNYDGDGRLVQLVNRKSNGEIISSLGYAYDNVGNRVTMTTLEGTHHYKYDEKYQLVGVTYPDGSSATYEYDMVGNRISATEGGNITGYTVNELDQYISVGGVAYEYDENGNLIENDKDSYLFNCENQLIQATITKSTYTFDYDFLGRRIKKKGLTRSTNYLYDREHVIMEVDENGSIMAKYVYGLFIDEILKLEKGGMNYYYVHDDLGSATNLADNLESIIETYHYTAYGHPCETSTVGNPQLFCGSRFDEDLFLYYCRSRYYAAGIGRFISADRLRLDGEIDNLYSYVKNNPVNLIDPLGQKWAFGRGRGWEASIGVFVGHSAGVSIGASVGLSKGIWIGPNICIAGIGLFIGASWGISLGYSYGYSSGFFFGWKFGDPTFIQQPENGNPSDSTLSPPETAAETQALFAQISIPFESSLVRGSVPIFGFAGGAVFEEYRLDYGKGSNPENWMYIGSSKKPQTRNLRLPEVSTASDITIIGNLGNWDTGLKEYIYLPTYPPDHPVDLHGVYTLRLVVIGKNGETVEDRVTVEVGRVISNAFGGTALSHDHKVILTVTEQSIMDSFRIISIKPTEKTTVPIDTSHKLIGNIYEFREPGERFTKPATLQMKWSNEDLQGFTPDNLGIYTYNPEAKSWQYLPTQRINEEDTLITTLTQITPKIAYSAILASNSLNEGSAIYEPSPAKPTPQENTQDPYLFLNTFDNSLAEWSNRDGEVGATISLDNIATPGETYCLRLTNKKRGGNFASNIRQTPFDARKYPLVRFDYKIPQDVEMNFLVKVSGRWYDIQFTDDSKEYKYKRVNMAGIGKIEEVIADNNWHTAEFNLYEMLRTKTRNYIVEEMIMADWDITGYMKLEFGHNHQGATYYIDNFGIWKNPQASIEDDNIVLGVDDFDDEHINSLKGSMFTFTDNQGLGKVQTLLTDEQPIQNQINAGHSLLIKYDVFQQNAYAGYVTMLENVDLTGYQTLAFWIKGKQGGETLLVGIKDGFGQESKLLVERYLSSRVTKEWQKVTVPLSAFTKIQNWRTIENLNFCFENCMNSEYGEICIDNIQFERTLETIIVDDFEGRNGKNLIGGTIRSFSNGNCTINVAYDTFNTFSDSTAFSISYSGVTGNLFTYSGWTTELNGLDFSAAGTISFYIKGAEGRETPNLYLDDGTNRACVIIRQYVQITTSWQKVTIPLGEFTNQGIDLTHLQEVQIVFEWEDMSGTIWIDNLEFSS